MNKYYKQGIALLMTAVMLSGVACSNKDDKEESEAESVAESVSETAETVSAIITPAGHSDSEGWICPNCGAAGNLGAFCASCGSPKPASAETEDTALQTEPSVTMMTYETFEDQNGTGSTHSVFGTPSPFTVVDPETGLELQLVGNGSFCYDLGENEVSEDLIKTNLISSFQSRAVNAVEAEGYSNLSQNIPDIERGIESDLRLALGIVNVDVAINSCILNEESQEAYDAATGR
jgi:hypothetical protein